MCSILACSRTQLYTCAACFPCNLKILQRCVGEGAGGCLYLRGWGRFCAATCVIAFTQVISVLQRSTLQYPMSCVVFAVLCFLLQLGSKVVVECEPGFTVLPNGRAVRECLPGWKESDPPRWESIQEAPKCRPFPSKMGRCQ